jgi:two-component sensor histidine kinase
LEESERRVRSIAVVHEILSRDTTDQVDFNDILPALVRMAEDMSSADRPVRINIKGDAGQLQAAVATPLAVAINELLQNAAEHALPGSDGSSLVVDLELERTDSSLRLTVRDNGVGLPDDFSVDSTSTLGLQIVRGLIGSQMGGTISMRNEHGTVVELIIPLDQPSENLAAI